MKTKVSLYKTDNEKVPATMEIFIVATQTEHGIIIHNGNNGIDETEKKYRSDEFYYFAIQRFFSLQHFNFKIIYYLFLDPRILCTS